MLNITNTTKQSPISKDSDFVAISEKVLGKRYDLSLVFVGEKAAKKLNQDYRKGDYVPNVLSFPLSESAGEIFICLKKIKKECADFEMTPIQYEKFLFIHGCLHLKGHDHGDKMEKLEKKFIQEFC
jgi:probable rRNA maturation factor